jgi:lysine 2,3-aminomutase
MQVITKLDKLEILNLIPRYKIDLLNRIIQNHPFRITKELANTVSSNLNSPLYKQFIPDLSENNYLDVELEDPIGDLAHQAVKGIVHRYPGRCLLMPTTICPVYCRFCFRKERVGPGHPSLTKQELQQAINYIASNTNIWEVILSGGDPLMLAASKIKFIIDQLIAIPHVKVIRVHSRVPILEPSRITEDLVAALKIAKAVYVLVHVNHKDELSAAALAACKKLIDNGIPVLAQTVLLKDINDNIEALAALMCYLVENKIKPYYLHHCDLARGTQHFRTSIQAGQQLVQQLRGRFSGLCQPLYVLDLPGGFGKVPIAESNIVKNAANSYLISDYMGIVHKYTDA